jgi:ribonuclease P protein component
LKRIYRLRQRSRFDQIRREGKCWAAPLVVLCVLPNDLAWSRFGFSASRRVGKAVVRNRVRRRMREVVRLRQTGIAPGWDLVFIARQPIVRADYQEIEEAIEQLLNKAHLLLPQESFSDGRANTKTTGPAQDAQQERVRP